MRREYGDDAVDGLRGIERVQCREHQVTSLGGEERRLNGFEVAHLTDQDNVGILSKRAAQRVAERPRIDADLALVDDRALVPMEVLDRVLDGHDVRGTRRVDPVSYTHLRAHETPEHLVCRLL